MTPATKKATLADKRRLAVRIARNELKINHRLAYIQVACEQMCKDMRSTDTSVINTTTLSPCDRTCALVQSVPLKVLEIGYYLPQLERDFCALGDMDYDRTISIVDDAEFSTFEARCGQGVSPENCVDCLAATKAFVASYECFSMQALNTVADDSDLSDDASDEEEDAFILPPPLNASDSPQYYPCGSPEDCTQPMQ